MNMNFDIIINSKKRKNKIDSLDIINMSKESESSVYIEAIENNLHKFTKAMINREIDIQDKKFRIVSERIFEDCITVYLHANNVYIKKCFSIVEKLNKFYKRLYLDTTSSMVRLYQGKFSGLFDLYNITVRRNEFDDIISSDTCVEKIILTALHNGSCRVCNDLSEITKSNLNWLELNDLIFITNINGYSIKISTQCEQIMLSNRKSILQLI